ncbi:protein root UVB sensitive 5-like isoform X2 [Cucurbita maxima]|uniref:Protein root UVB sensitive 5-like isoform X2 n=1 Tax=Cucurbita maxima TaxID=3661 RepID=A0A6J1IKS4_CUCMA|nr:protein root UVB sensitive 5-like isoform X2 [Cucurbita maxima]XP_022978318.1 protein root UVB sensitive 5-like isoform X2 [Cucurbita maxima]
MALRRSRISFRQLLAAVGICSFSGTTAAASNAAISELPSFPGGRFSNLFDDVPEQWRVYADFLAVQEAPLILLLHASYLFSTIGFPWQSY